MKWFLKHLGQNKCSAGSEKGFLSSSLVDESAGLLEHYSTHLDIHLHGQYRGRVRLVGGHDT